MGQCLFAAITKKVPTTLYPGWNLMGGRILSSNLHDSWQRSSNKQGRDTNTQKGRHTPLNTAGSHSSSILLGMSGECIVLASVSSQPKFEATDVRALGVS